MRIVRHDPWSVLTQWQKDLERMARDSEGDEDTSVATSAWTPAVDIKEDDEKFIILADIPGVEPKDIEITMENSVLSIKGERSLENEEERRGFKRMERVRGAFHRRFSLPETADAEKISASGKNGVLEISIPKRQIAQARKIVVEG